MYYVKYCLFKITNKHLIFICIDIDLQIYNILEHYY